LPDAPDWLWETTGLNWLHRVLPWMEDLVAKLTQGSAGQGVWRQIHESIARVKSLLDMVEPEQISLELIRDLLEQILQQASVPLEGLATDRVQVMGLFESRTLDFDHVLVVPAQEGKLPSGAHVQTFLTENLRSAFGLLTRSQRIEDEIYQFYRLMYRSRSITLVHDQSPDAKPSRLIAQLVYNTTMPARSQSAQLGISLPLPVPVVIGKDEVFASQVQRYTFSAENPEPVEFSPSTLHDLLICSLRFYFKKIERIEPPEDLPGHEMSPTDFGAWVHETIQALFVQVAGDGRMIQPADYDQMIMAWDGLQEETWNHLIGKESTMPLSHYVIEKAVGKEMGRRFLESMKGSPNHKWLQNEWKLPHALLPGTRNPSQQWAVSGRADIVLESDHEIWLIDLKTGSFNSDAFYALAPEKPEVLQSKVLQKKDLFQMLMYDWVAARSVESSFAGKPVRAKLFYMANPNARLIDPLVKHTSEADVLSTFQELEQLVVSAIEDLLDQDQPILQTHDRNQCVYCDFASICSRG